jgi:arginine/lysine/ornithine decarboxylase
MSIHPTLRNAEVRYIVQAIRQLCEHFPKWQEEYQVDWSTNTITAKEPTDEAAIRARIANMFERVTRQSERGMLTL